MLNFVQGGVPIGADPDPTLNDLTLVNSMTCLRFGGDPTTVLIHKYGKIGRASKSRSGPTGTMPLGFRNAWLP